MAAPKPKGKRITAQVKLQIMAGKATPAPPVGPALGQHGANIMEFCKQFNAKTSGKDQAGLIIPAVVTIYQDRSFTFGKGPRSAFWWSEFSRYFFRLRGLYFYVSLSNLATASG